MKHLKHCETSWNSRHSMRSMRIRRRSMCLRLGQRRRRSHGGHSMWRHRRSMRRRRRSVRRRRRSVRRRRRSMRRRRRSARRSREVTGNIGRRHRRHGVSSDIGDCGVGITPQMCNRVTNHGDTSTFSKPESLLLSLFARWSWFQFSIMAPVQYALISMAESG